MKAAITVIALAVAGLLALPLLAGSTTSVAAARVCGDTAVILDTIRTVETGANYTTRITSSSASGAYAMLDSVWATWSARAGYGSRWPRAWQAPPDVQDTVAAALLHDVLDTYGSVDLVPVAWYYPIAIHQSELMNIIPMPAAGNVLTPRQYQTKWLTIYRAKATAATSSACAPTVNGDWALPLPKQIIDANPSMLDQPHAGYPAIDLIVPEGTPVYALTRGTVVSIHDWNGNWWRAGCSAGRPGCTTCGIGITFRANDGARITYCHGSALYVGLGDKIVPGQHVMDSGDTGRSGAPHLHIEIRLDNTRLCPQPELVAIDRGASPPAISALPTVGCFY